MDVGRPKEHDRHLPPRMVFRHGAYHHVWYEGKRQRSKKLSENYALALSLYYEREGVQPHGETVGHALSRYEAEVLPTKAPATRKQYHRYIPKLREVFGDCGLDAVKRRDVAQYLDRRTAKVEGNREIACLSSVFRSAIRWGWCDENPCLGAPRNPEPKRRVMPTEAQAAAIRLAASEQFRCMIDLVSLIGLRKADLLKLKLTDIDERGVRVVAQKTGVVRIYRWTPRLQEVIARAKALRRRVGSFYLFCTRNGTPYTANGFDAIWRQLCIRAGVCLTTAGKTHAIGVGIHSFRRLAITRAQVHAGLDYAQAVAGHKSRQATEIYVVPTEVEVLPLE